MTVETHPDLQRELGRRVRAARALTGKKQADLADDLGWHPDKIGRIEGGKQVPDALELVALAEATGVAITFFFGASPGLEDGARTLPPPLPVVKGGEV